MMSSFVTNCLGKVRFHGFTLMLAIFVIVYVKSRWDETHRETIRHHGERLLQAQMDVTTVNYMDGELTTEAMAPMRFHYRVNVYGRTHEIARTFRVNNSLLHSVHLPQRHFLSLSPQNIRRFVLVTSATRHSFLDNAAVVKSAQKYLPKQQILFYDVGLTPEQAIEVTSWCGVMYRKFNFTQYPGHVAQMDRQAYKILILHEVLEEYGGALWLDAQLHLAEGDFKEVLDAVLVNGGLVYLKPTAEHRHDPTPGDQTAGTPAHWFRQTPPVEEADIGGSTALLVYNTELVYNGALWWWYLCALDESCDSPVVNKMCKFQLSFNFRSYSECLEFYRTSVDKDYSDFIGLDIRRYMLYSDVVSDNRDHSYVLRRCQKHLPLPETSNGNVTVS